MLKIGLQFKPARLSRVAGSPPAIHSIPQRAIASSDGGGEPISLFSFFASLCVLCVFALREVFLPAICLPARKMLTIYLEFYRGVR
jgi:hypothetical protein